MKIFKFSFLLNGSMLINSLAENAETALARAKKLFGENETYEKKGFVFSHDSGDFSIVAKVKTPIKDNVVQFKPAKTKKKVELSMEDSIIEQYSRDTEVKL